MLMADAVSKLSAKTPGKEAVAMEAFAKSLRMVSFYALAIKILDGHTTFSLWGCRRLASSIFTFMGLYIPQEETFLLTLYSIGYF